MASSIQYKERRENIGRQQQQRQKASIIIGNRRSSNNNCSYYPLGGHGSQMRSTKSMIRAAECHNLRYDKFFQ